MISENLSVFKTTKGTRLILFIFFVFSVASVFSQTPVKQPNVTGDIYRYINFPSKFTDSRNVDVWLPPGYARDAKKRYAVLYVHDGQNLFNPRESASGVDWGIDETMTLLVSENKIRAAIVVGIWSTPKRTLEFMPQKAFDAAIPENKKSPQPVYTNSGSDDYLRFIVNELKPFIDRNYRTKTDRENTFVMGSSMGGLMALYALSEYPNVFGGAASLSTQFPLGRGAILDYMEKNLPSPNKHKIYFDYGTEGLDKDYEPYQARADAILRKKGYKAGKNWITRKFPGAGHDEKSWRKRVDIPLGFLLKK